MAVTNQVAIIYAAINGLLDDIKEDKIKEFEEAFHKYLKDSQDKLLAQIEDKKDLDDEIEAGLKKAIEEFKKGLEKDYFVEKVKENK
jgi:F-type H+-transporting ATPase subunit alpha